MKHIKKQRKYYGIIAASITLIIPFLLIFFDQNIALEYKQSFCPFKMLTGFPCPGCGVTKSLVFLYEFDLYKSLYYNAFGPLIIFFCLFTIILLSVELITNKEYFNQYLYNKKLAIVLGFILGCYHIIRLIYFIKNHSLADIAKESIWF